MSVSRNTVYNLTGAVIPLLLSLATVPAYLHLIGPDRYGVLAISWLLLGYFGLFDLGLGRATQYKIAALKGAPPEERARTFWSALAVNVGMGLVGGAVLWIAAGLFFAYVFKVDPALRPEIMRGVPFLAMAVPIATLTGVLTGALQGREKFLQTNSISVTSTTLFQLFPLSIAWFFGPNLPHLLAAAIFARLLAVGVLGFRCHQEITRGHPRTADMGRAKELLSYGGWVMLTSIFGPMLVIVDRFMIGAVLGAVAVTIYSLPFQLAQRIAIIPSALTNALFPRLSYAHDGESRQMGESALAAIGAVLTPPVVAAVFLIGPFLTFWVGKDLGLQAAPVGRLLIIAFWANAFALVPFVRLQASGRPDMVAKILIVQIPPYLGGLYFAMQHYGLFGLGLAFLLRCLVDFAMLSWFVDRNYSGYRQFLPQFTLVALALVGQHFTQTSPPFMAAVATALLGCAMILSWCRFPPAFKANVLTFIRRFTARVGAHD